MKKILFLFLLALVLRLAFLGVWYAAGQGGRLSGDGTDYYRIATHLAEGRGFQITEGEPSGRRPPLYPAMMALLLKTGVPFPLSVQIFQCILGAFTAIFLFQLGKEIFNASTGFYAALILALDYLCIRETAAVMSETLFVFFLMGSFLFLYKALSQNKNSLLAASGIFAGLSLLTRDVAIFFFPFAGLWLFLFSGIKKGAVKRAGIYAIALALTIAPWVVRNTFLFKRPILITTTAGHTFYLANNLNASGGRTGGDWETTDTRYPEMNQSVPLFTPQADQYLFREAFSFIIQNPGQFIRLIGRKIVNTWRPYQTDAPRLTQGIQGGAYLAILFLAAGGIFQTRNRWREFLPIYAFMAYIFLLHAILISGIRYRFPVMPFFMLFAGFSLSRIKALSRFFDKL